MPAWYYQTNEGHLVGPLEFAQLHQLAISGVLLPDHMIRNGEGTDWRAAQTVPGLFPPKTFLHWAWNNPWPVAVIIGLAMLGLKFVGCLREDASVPILDPNPLPRIAREVAKADALVIGAKDLVRDYGQNEIAADKKYKDKILEINGTITRIVAGSRGALGQRPQIFVNGVCCEFLTNGEVEHVLVGQVVTLRGKCIRHLNMCLICCRLLEPKSP